MFIVVLLLVIIVVGFLAFYFDGRCPSCKQPNAMEKKEEKLISQESISKIEELKRKDKNGNVIGTKETRVYGVRKKYQVTRECRHCGYTDTVTETKDIY